MMTLLAVVTAVIVTIILSNVGIPIFTILNMFIFGFGVSVAPKRFKNLAVHIIQTITYAMSDFIGLYAGALILKKANSLRFLSLLICIVILSSVLYAIKRFSFATEEAEKLNKGQKFAAIIGVVLAILAVLILRRNW